MNVKNRTIFCRDNLDILQGINSNCVDLIYLDPPFNKKKIFTAPIGSSAEGAAFSDIFSQEDIKDEWVSLIKFENHELYSYLIGVKEFSNLYNYCYLVYMAIRLIECRRVLKETGAIYLHCDPTMSHYLKVVLDCIFNERNFKNEIIWCYSIGGKSKLQWGRKHDVIFYYTKSGKHVFNAKDVSISRKPNTHMKLGMDADGRAFQEKKDKKTGKIYKYYIDEGKIPEDYWTDINTLQKDDKQRTGYPTQKPLALLERIINASSNAGDVVLDPFCGCATTCVAAERLNRQWIGVDISIKAYELIKKRLDNEIPAMEKILWEKEVNFSTAPPIRNDESEDGERGYVYVISNPAWKDSFKVGIAKDVNRRLASYQTSAPKRDFVIEYSIRAQNYKEVEAAVFEKFDGNRDNEWVNASKEEIIATIEELAN